MLRAGRLAAVVLGALALVAAAPGAVAADGPCRGSCDGGSASGGTSADSITVTVSGSGVIPGHGSVPIDTSKIAVHPLCWYSAFATGKEYAEFVESGRAAELAHHHDDYETVEGWEEHRDDDKGHWYGGTCSSAYWKGETIDGFFEASEAWFADHHVVWVDGGDAPPDPLVTPEMLAEVARSEMRIPKGELHWNPTREGDAATFVGLDTWVWLDGAPTSVEVTASVYGGAVWARVDATLDHIDVSADGAPNRRCDDTGTPWSPGATTTTCSIAFVRSSATQPRDSDGVRRSTLRAAGSWTASWVSSLGGGRIDLPAPAPVVTTARVPVAEIESVATQP
ncbi:MAG: hypothetical protein AAGC49_01750 [Brevundimonas sp.]